MPEKLIDLKYMEKKGVLGAKTGDIIQDGAGVVQYCKNGIVTCLNKSKEAVAVYGKFYEKYFSIGGHKSLLGLPTADEKKVGEVSGITFQRGSILQKKNEKECSVIYPFKIRLDVVESTKNSIYFDVVSIQQIEPDLLGYYQERMPKKSPFTVYSNYQAYKSNSVGIYEQIDYEIIPNKLDLKIMFLCKIREEKDKLLGQYVKILDISNSWGFDDKRDDPDKIGTFVITKENVKKYKMKNCDFKKLERFTWSILPESVFMSQETLYSTVYKIQGLEKKLYDLKPKRNKSEQFQIKAQGARMLYDWLEYVSTTGGKTWLDYHHQGIWKVNGSRNSKEHFLISGNPLNNLGYLINSKERNASVWDLRSNAIFQYTLNHPGGIQIARNLLPVAYEKKKSDKAGVAFFDVGDARKLRSIDNLFMANKVCYDGQTPDAFYEKHLNTRVSACGITCIRENWLLAVVINERVAFYTKALDESLYIGRFKFIGFGDIFDSYNQVSLHLDENENVYLLGTSDNDGTATDDKVFVWKITFDDAVRHIKTTEQLETIHFTRGGNDGPRFCYAACVSFEPDNDNKEQITNPSEAIKNGEFTVYYTSGRADGGGQHVGYIRVNRSNKSGGAEKDISYLKYPVVATFVYMGGCFNGRVNQCMVPSDGKVKPPEDYLEAMKDKDYTVDWYYRDYKTDSTGRYRKFDFDNDRIFYNINLFAELPKKVYWVSKKAQKDGEHEVHVDSCKRKPYLENRHLLGSCVDEYAAMDEAKKIYKKVDGCYYCCKRVDSDHKIKI